MSIQADILAWARTLDGCTGVYHEVCWRPDHLQIDVYLRGECPPIPPHLARWVKVKSELVKTVKSVRFVGRPDMQVPTGEEVLTGLAFIWPISEDLL